MKPGHLLASIFVLLASAPLPAQTASDTLPTRVVERLTQAFNRKDLDGTFASYDTVFVHETLGDPKGAERVRREDWVRKMKSDTSLARFMKDWRVTHVERGASGAWVYDIWTMRGPKGKTVKHVNLFEVRNGKVVREIEG